MTKRQFREANQKAFISNAIVIIAMFALTVVEGILFQMTAAVFVCLAACVVGFIISLTGYLSAKDTKRGEVLILSGAMLAYFIIMLAQDNLMFFPFALPILFSAIVYLDIKVVLYGEAAMVVSYAICMVRKLMFAKGGPDVQQAILFTVVLILCCVGATETIFLLNKFKQAS